MISETDYYSVLGLTSEAGPASIRNAYRKLAVMYHPDKNADNQSAVEMMKKVNEAYAVLSDVKKKKEYDIMRSQYGASAYSRFRSNYSESDIFSGSDVNKLFEELAKEFGFRGVDDIFKECYGNGFKTFGFGAKGLFAKGFVFSYGFGKKGVTEHKQKTGINKVNHLGIGKFFEKLTGSGVPEDGIDNTDVVWLSEELVRKGGPYAYYDKKSKRKLVINIPAGTCEGQRIRLSGMGFQGKKGGKPGDLYLKVCVKKSIFEQLKGFFTKKSN